MSSFMSTATPSFDIETVPEHHRAMVLAIDSPMSVSLMATSIVTHCRVSTTSTCSMPR